jgi:inorganic pyrophosphatase
MSHLLYLPSFSERGHLNAVIEIPAGTNQKYEVDKTTGLLRPDVRDGQARVVAFLPYPVNYGFIPSTLMDKERGGDGDPLDVLVLAETQPRGSVLEVLPLGLMLLQDGGELDHKVLAIPADPALRIVSVESWTEFQQQYSVIRHMLELFFLYYDGLGVMTPMGWADEQAALEEVKKWHLSPR